MATAGQIVLDIVRSTVGLSGPLKREDLVEAARVLGSRRDTSGAAALATFCRQFWLVYQNHSYNMDENGERWILRQLAPFGPKVLFDVGANDGDWLRVARAEVPGAHVHAFEIVGDTFTALTQRVPPSPSITFNAHGLSDHAGQVEMHTYGKHTFLASHVAFPHGDHQRVPCPVRRGDDYLDEHGIERIDFLKIDVEGAEHLVLDGFSRALDAGRVDVIQFEYGKVNVLTRFLLRDFYLSLEARGFALGKLFPNHVDFRAYALEDEDFMGPNYVAVRRARRDLIDAVRKPPKRKSA